MKKKYEELKEEFAVVLTSKEVLNKEIAFFSKMVEHYDRKILNLNHLCWHINSGLLISTILVWIMLGFNIGLVAFCMWLASFSYVLISSYGFCKKINIDMGNKQIVENNLARIENEYENICIKETKILNNMKLVLESLIELKKENNSDNPDYLKTLDLIKSQLESEVKKYNTSKESKEEKAVSKIKK